ncbi:MAG: methyl-accepting chemotaxis protein [Candidatus Omnitrophica bacterium]|nr:methyl-accepting chemotaxis protein [Candidatus Omnitrophota bacterium]MBU1924576.1 methyl-accepting chemotaxis protein [Candidatus Omnitrophota bacterium]
MFKLKIFSKTLEFKIAFWLNSALILVLTVTAVVNTTTQNRTLLEQEKRLALVLTKSILNALRFPMLNGNQENVQKSFDNLAAEALIKVLYLTDKDGVIRRSTDKSIIGRSIDSAHTQSKQGIVQEFEKSRLIKDGKKVSATYILIRNETACAACHGESSGDNVLGVLGLELDWDKISAAVNETKVRSILISILSILSISILFIILLRRLVIRPIGFLIKDTEPITRGDLSKKIRVTSEDEIGRLAQVFNDVIENLHEMVSRIREMASKVSSFAQEISTSSKEMNSSTLEISTTIQKIAKGVTTQAKRVEDTSRLMEEMSASVKQISVNAKTASVSSEESLGQARSGGGATTEAVEKMNRITATVSNAAAVVRSLGDKSKQIGQITETITSIADQTNLLALNAAIEAARAGDAGRGFAVVAEEVRKLAEGSAEAARRIGTLIKGIQVETPKAVSSIEAGSKEVAEGALIVSRVSAALEKIIGTAKESATMVNEITAATARQMSNAEQIVKAVDEVAVVAEESASATQEASSSAQEQTASMEELTASAEELARLAIDLQAMVDRFKLL